jgi:hypothetical protein
LSLRSGCIISGIAVQNIYVTVATQVEKDLIYSISIGILSALLEEFLGKPFLPESPESPHSPLSPELGDCIIPNSNPIPNTS